MNGASRKAIWGAILLLSLAATGKAVLGQEAAATPVMMAGNTSDPPPKTSAAKPPRKVWTDDDVTSLRTAADQYADEKAAKEEAVASAAAQTNGAKALPEGVQFKHSALTDPKSTQEANKMIAWESRDIDSQVDYLSKLQVQLRTATGAEQQHLLSEKTRMEGILAQSRQELKTLQAQKAELEKTKPDNQ